MDHWRAVDSSLLRNSAVVEPQCRQRGAALLAASQCRAPLLPPGPPGVSSSLVDVIHGEVAGDGVDTGDGLLGNAGGGYLAGAGSFGAGVGLSLDSPAVHTGLDNLLRQASPLQDPETWFCSP